MAPSDARDAPIDALGEDDLDGALALSAEAGWNQVAADWLLMLRLGSGFAVRDGGRVVATALALPYPPAFGWVSMVLVHGPYRRRGLATRLVERATAALTGDGLAARARRDARPARRCTAAWASGPSGSLHALARHGRRRRASPRREPPAGADRVRDLDRAAFGADRGARPRRPRRAPRTGRRARRRRRRLPALPRRPHGDPARAARRARRRRPRSRCSPQGSTRVGGTVVVDVPERATARRRAPRRPRLRARAAVRAAWRSARDELAGDARARPRHRRPGARLMRWQDLPADALAAFRAGTVIPAHPLALDAERRLDERRQRALTRYYLDAGAGGLAVGVHTTQFAIRDVGLYRPVLELAVETARALDATRPLVPRRRRRRTHASRPSPRRGSRASSATTRCSSASRRSAAPSEEAMLAHCRALADELPVVGFYLQPAVGGVAPLARVLDALRRDRERGRHQGRAVRPLPHARRRPRRRRGGRAGAHLALHRQRRPHRARPDGAVPHATAGELRFVGGLLGHWSVWTRTRRRAPRALPRRAPASTPCPPTCWRSTARVTDCNAAFFDVAQRVPRRDRRLPRGAAPPGPARRAAGASTRRRT